MHPHCEDIYYFYSKHIYWDDRDSSRKMGMQKSYWEPIIEGSFVYVHNVKDKHNAV